MARLLSFLLCGFAAVSFSVGAANNDDGFIWIDANTKDSPEADRVAERGRGWQRSRNEGAGAAQEAKEGEAQEVGAVLASAGHEGHRHR
jgi:hypothetical protein